MENQDENLDHALAEEFAGQKDAIHALKVSNNHFKKLLVTNHQLWNEIQNIQNDVTPADDMALETLEKERLLVLDEIGDMLRAAEA